MLKPRFLNRSYANLAVPGAALTAALGSYIYYRDPAPKDSTPAEGGQAERSRNKRDKEALGGAGIGGNATSGGHETGQPGSGVQPGTGDVERRQTTTAGDRDDLPSGGVGGGYGGGNDNTRAVSMSPKGDTQSDLGLGSGSGSSGSNSESNKSSSSSSSNQTQRSGKIDPKNGNPERVPSRADSSESSTRGADSYAAASKDGKYKGSSSETSNNNKKSDNSKASTTSAGGGLSETLQGVFGQGGRSSEGYTMDRKKYGDTRVASHGETPTKRHQMRSDS